MPELFVNFSMVPLIFALELVAIFIAARSAARLGVLRRPSWIYALLILLSSWGVASTCLAYIGVYQSDAFLAAYPTMWLPFIPVVLVVIPLLLFATARDAVRELIDATPATFLVGIHAVRILAIGGLLKAWRGEFSMSFALWVGIPDLLFGLSALAMIWLAMKNRISMPGLLLWNLLGVLVILPGAPLVGQRGLPGALHAINETPSMTTLYEFPMVLAPSLVVPVFVMMNLFISIRLLERLVSNRQTPVGKLVS